MSTYVISDIHGQYKSFLKMLDLIRFGKDDTLYVLGDAIDRGPDGIKILLHLMKMENAEMFMGNHELLMLDALKNEFEIQNKNRKDTDDLDIWLDPCNGGLPTYNAFKALPASKKQKILDYLKDTWVVKKVNIGKKKYYLAHAYCSKMKFDEGIRFMEIPYSETYKVVWTSIYDFRYQDVVGEKLFPNKKNIYIHGHTFTQRLDCVDKYGRGLIYENNDFMGYHIKNIDCGMALRNKASQLGCIRLEDERKFYVYLEDGFIE